MAGISFRSRLGCVLILALAGVLPAHAQRSRRLDCPGAPRAASGPRLTLPPVHWELSAGAAQPFLYRNAAATSTNYSFRGRAFPYLGITGYTRLSERLEGFAGVSLTLVWQGLRFSHAGTFGDVQIDGYSGSWTATLPLGIRYRAGKSLGLSAGPYLSVSTHREGDQTADLGPDRFYRYQAPADLLRLNGGLRLAADLRLSRRLGAVISGAADAGMATPSSALADLDGDGAYRSTLQPYLLHLGVGLTYRFQPDAD